MTAVDLQVRLQQVYGPNYSLVQSAYPTGTPEKLLRAELDSFGDDGFNYPMWKWATMQEQAGLPAYRYIFGRTLSTSSTQEYKGIQRSLIGAFHGDEVAYAFGTLDIAPLSLDGTNRGGRWEDSDRKLSETMVSFWTNFVKSGSPNGPGQLAWPRYQEELGNPIVHFDSVVDVKFDDRASRMHLLDTAFRESRLDLTAQRGNQ
jgi:para-nitrobenzyl esterase